MYNIANNSPNTNQIAQYFAALEEYLTQQGPANKATLAAQIPSTSTSLVRYTTWMNDHSIVLRPMDLEHMLLCVIHAKLTTDEPTEFLAFLKAVNYRMCTFLDQITPELKTALLELITETHRLIGAPQEYRITEHDLARAALMSLIHIVQNAQLTLTEAAQHGALRLLRCGHFDEDSPRCQISDRFELLEILEASGFYPTQAYTNEDFVILFNHITVITFSHAWINLSIDFHNFSSRAATFVFNTVCMGYFYDYPREHSVQVTFIVGKGRRTSANEFRTTWDRITSQFISAPPIKAAILSILPDDPSLDITYAAGNDGAIIIRRLRSLVDSRSAQASEEVGSATSSPVLHARKLATPSPMLHSDAQRGPLHTH